MPTKETPEKLLKKHLGEEGANAILTKIDKMVADGASAAAIEKAIDSDITAHIQSIIVSAVIVDVKPQPITVKPLSVSVGTQIKTTPPIKISSATSTKVNTNVGLTIKPTVTTTTGPGIKVPGK
jgi:hypothetical protein